MVRPGHPTRSVLNAASSFCAISGGTSFMWWTSPACLTVFCSISSGRGTRHSYLAATHSRKVGDVRSHGDHEGFMEFIDRPRLLQNLAGISRPTSRWSG